MENEKIQINKNKILKLTNVLVREISLKNKEDFAKEVTQMDNYIKNKGVQPIGPHIQYTHIDGEKIEEVKLILKIMRQSNTFIHNVEAPYKMESVIRVKNCMYARYTGEESKLKFAYDKINLIAFEEDISLKGDSYTIFINSNEDGITADVFMERADDE